MDASDPGDKERVYWHSRRGMLELDLLLMPFARERYPHLDVEGQAGYRRLLESEDVHLYRWLVAGDPCPDQRLCQILRSVLDHGRTRASP